MWHYSHPPIPVCHVLFDWPQRVTMHFFTRISIHTNDVLPVVAFFHHWIKKYCLIISYSFKFDSFEASQAVYRNLWYIKSPLWKVICLLSAKFVISTQVAKKSTFWLPSKNEYLTSREYTLWHTTNAICCFSVKKLVTQGHVCLQKWFFVVYELRQLTIS